MPPPSLWFTPFRRRDNYPDTGGVTELAAFFEKHQQKKTHTPVDPNKLPFRTPDGKVRAPKESKKELQALLLDPKPLILAGPALPGMLPLGLRPSPTPDDLAPTEDVQITQAIKDLAASLDKNPVKIHQWVRNNIQFIPTYGSIQGSDMTLQTRRGNAFDTASLLIALLRASNIPARYAYGTIQVPIDKVMNWVGEVTKPEAALQLLGQGGIPSIGLTSGGTFSAVKLEHVWVEAYVDYIPSRGAINKQGDTWVPLDASFKQYQFTQGLDIKGAVPLDTNALLTQVQTGATVNETEGWVQHVNSATIQTALTNYQAQVKTYIDQTQPNATVGDVLGTQTIIPENFPHLMGTLPYKTLATGSKFTALPDQLRWKYRTILYADALCYALGGGELISLSQNTVRLAGKKITLSFIPASQADTDLVNSYLPKPHADGTPIQPSELPTSLPGYLIHLTAELRVDGQVVSTGGNFTMGTELLQASAIFNPATQSWEEGEPNKPIAGEYHAIALDLQGIGASQIAALRTKLDDTQAKFVQFQQTPNDPSPIQTLTKEDISGPQCQDSCRVS